MGSGTTHARSQFRSKDARLAARNRLYSCDGRPCPRSPRRARTVGKGLQQRFDKHANATAKASDPSRDRRASLSQCPSSKAEIDAGDHPERIGQARGLIWIDRLCLLHLTKSPILRIPLSKL